MLFVVGVVGVVVVRYECSNAELDLLDGVENFEDMRVNGNEHYHYEEYISSKVSCCQHHHCH